MTIARPHALSTTKIQLIELKKKEPFRQDSILIFRTEEGETQSSVSKSDMPPKKRPLLQGDNDGEGYPWKLVKASGAAGAHVFYGSDGRSMFKLKKGDQKAEPSEQRQGVLQRIAEHRDAKRKQQDDDEGGGGGKKAKGSRLAAEAAAVTSEAESSMSPSGSKEDRRVQTTFPHLSTPGRPDRDFDAERRSADERREHRRMAEGFGNIQKLVDEEMDEDGSDMCHILKLVAMAIFSQRGGSELGPSSPEEKLRLVADLVSSELQGMLKQHKAAPMGEQPGQGEELEMLVVIGISEV